jgi:hypothetical protein
LCRILVVIVRTCENKKNKRKLLPKGRKPIRLNKRSSGRH